MFAVPVHYGWFKSRFLKEDVIIQNFINLMETTFRYTETLTTSAVRPANSFVSNRSFISTNFANEVGLDELRKSRIQNLPSTTKKVALSGNLEFVVVFQTIEIERLSLQIESNRIKIRDFERQIFNAQNYEVQIRELTEKCFSYESERGKYLEENEKLNLICHQLYTELEEIKRKFAEVDLTMKDKYEMERVRNSELLNEIERWKARYMATEKSKAKELDDLRLMMESQRKSMLDREMRELTIKFQAERGNLENEIRKLRENLEYKLREIEELKQRSQKFEMTIMDLKRNEVTIRDLENKMTVISQELYRLNEILKQKQDELEAARQREFKLQQQLKEQQQWEFENKQLKTNLENRLREIEDWRIRYSKLDEEVSRNRDLAKVNSEINSRLGLAGKEIERLNDALRSKLEEIDSWKQRFAQQEAETRKYRNLETELRNYETKATSLNNEIERLNGILKQRLAEIDDWKTRVSKLQITIKSYTTVEKDNRDLQDKLQSQTRTIEDFRHKITRYETDINNLRLVEKKYEDSERRSGNLNLELERLNGLLKSKVQEADDFRVRHSKLESTLIQYKNIESKVKEYEHSFAVMTQEIERLNNVIRAKTDEITRLNQRCRGLEDQVAFLKSHETKLLQNQRTIDTLNITINEFKRNIQNEQDRTRGVENKIRQFEAQLYASTQEKDRLSGLLKQKGLEFDELRSKYSRLEQEMYQLKEIEAAYREAKNQIAGLTGEIERLERACVDRDALLKKEQEIGSDLGFRVIVLSAELERLNSGSGIKSKELLALKETFYTLQKSSREKESEIMVLQQRITNLQKQLTFVTSQLQRFLGLITANEKRAKQLQVQIATYQDYAKRIQILSAEIDRLVGQNKHLEQDLVKIRLRYSDNIAFEQKHEMLCMTFVMVFAEVEALRAKVAERDVQFEEMRKSYVATVRNINTTG